MELPLVKMALIISEVKITETRKLQSANYISCKGYLNAECKS